MARAHIVVDTKAVQKALREVDRDLPKELRVANKEAAEIGLRRAKSLAARYSRTGRLVGSMVVRAQQRAAYMKGGGKRVPYFGFIDFGNKPNHRAGVGRKDSHPREFIKGGRIMYRALGQTKRQALDVYVERVADLLRKAGLR